MVATSLISSLSLCCLLVPVSVLLITALSGGFVVSYYYWVIQPPIPDAGSLERYYNELLTLLKAAVVLLSVIPFLVLTFIVLLLSFIICMMRYSARRIRSRYGSGERSNLINTPVTSYTC